jgi:hypothetical protein
LFVILAASTAITTAAPDWCANPNAPDMPRNVEDTKACAAAGASFSFYMDRVISFSDGPQTCENAAKHLSEPGSEDAPHQVGDGYWVESYDLKTPAIRCHIVKIDGKTITMR